MMLAELDLSRVFANPDQPRKHFDPDKLQEIADSIRKNGLLQPITVRLLAPDPRCALGGSQHGDLAQYQIVAGERRWRAHKLIDAPTIKAFVLNMSDADRDVMAIIENLQRTDITPLEEARAYQRMLDRGFTVEGLAERLGLRQPWRVTERTSLLRLKPEYLHLLEHGHLTPSQAFEVSRLEPPQQDTLIRLIRDGECSTYNKLRAHTDALLAWAGQGSFFEPLAPSAAERDKINAFERKLASVIKVVASMFDHGEIVVLKKINPHRAQQVAQEIGLLKKHVSQIERHIEQVAAQASIESATH